MTRAGLGLGALMMLVALTAPGRVAAQQPAASASHSLPSSHWVLPVLLRLQAAGLLDDYLPTLSNPARAEALAALQSAAARADSAGHALAPLARELARRLATESGAESDGEGRAWSEWGVRFAEHRENHPEAPVARLPPLPDSSHVVAFGRVELSPSRHLALYAEPVLGERSGVDRWEVVGAWKGVALSLGRQAVGYAVGRGGAVVFSGTAPLERVQVATQAPVPVRWLGPTSFHAFLGRMDEERHVGDPFVWGARLQLRPHPRFTLGIQRGVIFGGSAAPLPTNWHTVTQMLIGSTSDGYDNQVVSVGIQYRPPTEAWLPALLYVEWGADDTAGAFRDSPGHLFGLLLPAVPGLPTLALGAEHAYFGNRCDDCRRVADPVHWYSHSAHTGGWTVHQVPLGHPLGGNGTEARLFGQAHLAGSAVALSGDVFRRDRTAGNLYEPAWTGESTGFSIGGRVLAGERSALEVEWSHEEGGAWRSEQLRLSLSRAF